MFKKTSDLCKQFAVGKTTMLALLRRIRQSDDRRDRIAVMPPTRPGQSWRARPEVIERYLRNG